jgi:hypothetical protein
MPRLSAKACALARAHGVLRRTGHTRRAQDPWTQVQLQAGFGMVGCCAVRSAGCALCVWVCACACVGVCVCACVRACVHVLVRARAHTHVRVCTQLLESRFCCCWLKMLDRGMQGVLHNFCQL